jgi:hypothetical protein
MTTGGPDIFPLLDRCISDLLCSRRDYSCRDDASGISLVFRDSFDIYYRRFNKWRSSVCTAEDRMTNDEHRYPATTCDTYQEGITSCPSYINHILHGREVDARSGIIIRCDVEYLSLDRKVRNVIANNEAICKEAKSLTAGHLYAKVSWTVDIYARLTRIVPFRIHATIKVRDGPVYLRFLAAAINEIYIGYLLSVSRRIASLDD